MSLATAEREEIKQDILKRINLHLFSVNKIAADYNISRQTVYRYLREMKEQAIITQQSDKQYSLAVFTWRKSYINDGLAEDEIWRQDIAPLCQDIPKKSFDKAHYIFAEMMNNAIEHSESEAIIVFIEKTFINLNMSIIDKGVGIFHKIQNAMQLPEKSFAILELAKGKLTTDPKGHTGEGIFFSSRIADVFLISSDGLDFSSLGGEYDTLESGSVMESGDGTAVLAKICFDSEININEVFRMYTEHPEHIGFNSTQVPVKLLDYGAQNPIFVSRSEARRLLTRFERFSKITLDFAGVEDIRQGFADEVFRVFPQEHPDCRLEVINGNAQVLAMIEHVKNTK